MAPTSKPVRRARWSSSRDTDGHHVEAGVGLELYSDGGFVLGVDARIGDASIDSTPVIYDDLYGAPLTLRTGQYRALRLTAGIRF